jgi:hypothetical protein
MRAATESPRGILAHNGGVSNAVAGARRNGPYA